VRVATWNINGLRSRLGLLAHWLAARKPDVVALQELKLTDEQFPRDELAAQGYQAIVHGEKGWNGVAILARKPLEVEQIGLPGSDFGARLVSARVEGLSVTSIYCPNGKSVAHADFPRKLAWYDALAAHWSARHPAGDPAILCGDFNLCPAAIDSWDEAGHAGGIFHTDDERTRFRALLAAGLFDVFRERHPDLQAFTWWDYRAGAFHKREGLRIDLVLATRPVLERVASVEIDREYRKKQGGFTASDHAPVIADLNP
jgi:exodeoxyribonuclease III